MPHVSPRWEDARTVAGFVSGEPNLVLLEFAGKFARAGTPPRCLDIGCGAARNAMGLAALGFRVTGTDLSAPMLRAAHDRVRASPSPCAVDFALAPMAPLPFPDDLFDLVVAHGIWNLAGSGAEFRAAIAEAARVAHHGAGLFLFTFSRRTLPDEALPDAGESFVFSSWNGEPQCFLTEDEIVRELGQAGFERDEAGPLTEYNVPRPGTLRTGGPPVIFEGTFVRRRKGMSDSHVMSVTALVEYQHGGIVSRQILKKPAGNVTAFAFDAGQELTEHASPFDALVEVVDGDAEITLAGQARRVRAGEMILLPANVPHAVKAVARFKMLLTMIRS